MNQLKHLYIGLREENNKLVTGFCKFTEGEHKGSVFTHAFISKKDAEKFYGKDNYTKIII